MNTRFSLLLTIFLSITAVCIMNSCEKECDPCNAECPDPSERFIGVWIVFESYLNGNPYSEPIGMEWDFRWGDSLIAFNDTLIWYAIDEQLIVMGESYTQQLMALVFEYYFDVDTLDMTGPMFGDTVRFKMLEEENMP